MRIRTIGILAVLMISSVVFTAAPAVAHTSLTATLCVSETAFEFEVTVDDVESDSILIELAADFASFQWIAATISVNQGDGTVAFSAGPSLNVTGGVPIIRWQLPFSDVQLSTVPGGSGWDVTFSGSIAQTALGFDPDDSLYDIFVREFGDPDHDLRLSDVPIADCGETPPTTTTTVAPTTTTEATTTTVATTTTEPVTTTTVASTTSSTVPPTVAPTSIVSTTVPGTTTIPEVVTDVANGDGTTPAVPVLIAVGFLVLVGATIRARRLER